MLELWFFLSCVALGTLKNILFQQQLVFWTGKKMVLQTVHWAHVSLFTGKMYKPTFESSKLKT